MGKDPAFLFYSSDFLSGVSDLTMEERGQYITLLCQQHQKGRISEKMFQISGATEDVKAKFEQDQDGYFQPRLEEEITKRRNYVKSRKDNLKGKHKNSHKGPLKVSLMENEDENGNVIRNRVEDENGFCEKIRNSLAAYFGFTEFNNFPNYQKAQNFAEYIVGTNQVDRFKELASAYYEYKEITGETRHGFLNYIGYPEHIEGGWNQENWHHRLEDYVKRNPKKRIKRSINLQRAADILSNNGAGTS